MEYRRRDEGTNSTLRTKEQGTHLTLNEHDDDDEDIYIYTILVFILAKTETLCGQTQDILLLKGTKHHLSVYDKMPTVRRIFLAYLIFQFI